MKLFSLVTQTGNGHVNVLCKINAKYLGLFFRLVFLPREFEQQDMAKIFNKKIKTRFPILFKRALDFHLMKAQSRLR